MPAPSQAATLADQLPTPASRESGQPIVVIPSVLKLTAEQEERLLTHARDRFQKLSTDLGRQDYETPVMAGQAPTLTQQNCASHFGRRHLSHLIFNQRMEWRSWVVGGIYAETNLHLPLTTRIVGQQVARANKSFFGTSPYFAVSGLSQDSDILASDVDAYAQHQLDTLGGIAAGLQSAVELAFIQGECAVKTRHHRLTSYFESLRTVLVDDKGQPYTASDGDYIYQTDIFVQAEMPQIDPATGQPVLDEQGQPVMQFSEDLVLKRDMTTPRPAVMIWKEVRLDLIKVLADKVESQPIYYLDFLCPLDAPDVQSADIAIHCYNAKVIEMADRYLRDTWGGTPPAEQVARVADLVHRLKGGSPEARQALATRERAEQGETTFLPATADAEPVTGLAECWLWYDVFGDGVLRSIMLLMDQEGKIPIFYDYAANLTPDGLRPIDIVRINPVAGRWTGNSNVERFYNLQDAADLLINRQFFAESRAARVDFFEPSAVVEGRDNPNLELNGGKAYRLEPGKKAEDALSSVYLTNNKANNLQGLLQTLMQVMQAMSAVSNVNDGAMAGLDTAKLATGIKNLEASGEELFHQYISHLRPCLEAILRRSLKTLIHTAVHDAGGKEKIARFFDRPSKRFVEIDPTRLDGLDLDIVLNLSTYDRQSRLQSSQLAFNILSAYLQSIQAPPQVIEQRLGPLVADQLRALQVRDADTKTAPIPPELRALMMPPPADPSVSAGPAEPLI